MRTIRALAAAAALAGLLTASGPAAAKIMQLTLAGKINGGFQDVTDYMGVGCGCNGNDQYLVDFVLTYDTDRPIPSYGSAATLLSGRLEIRAPDDPNNDFVPGVTPTGELLGAFNIPVGQNSLVNGNGNYIEWSPYIPGYYNVHSSFLSSTEVGALFIYFPVSGAGLLDKDMTYYPDPSADIYHRFYGNSIYDLLFVKEKDDHSGLIYDIHTETIDSGAINTFYVNFKDITPQGVPEPAAWALMLLGFGGVGAALRRRRAAGLAV